MTRTISGRFLKPNHPLLSQVAAPVALKDIAGPSVKADIETMVSVATGEQMDRNRSILVGLAAPQIGISKRIILVDLKARGQGTVGQIAVYINPQITWYSSEQTEYYEGCFSTDTVKGIVPRPTSITIVAYDETGQPLEETYSGFTARIFQHEIDHLNGIEFVQHVANPEHLHLVTDTEMVNYRDKEAWRNWPRKCSREEWNAIKGLEG